MKKGIANLWGREPAMVLGVVQASIAMGVTLGLKLTVEQVGAIMTFSAAVVALVTRASMSSPAQVAKKVADAKTISEPAA